MKKSCPSGLIKSRQGECITPIKLSPGVLGEYGYKNVKNMTELARHRALLRVIRDGKEEPLSLFRRLNALMVLFKYKDPKLSVIFKKDRDYIRKKFVSK